MFCAGRLRVGHCFVLGAPEKCSIHIQRMLEMFSVIPFVRQFDVASTDRSRSLRRSSVVWAPEPALKKRQKQRCVDGTYGDKSLATCPYRWSGRLGNLNVMN